VGIQSAIATVEPNNSVNDDCRLCAKKDVDEARVKSLLIQLETVTNSIMLRYGHIPEVKEKCEKVLDSIDLFDIYLQFCLGLAVIVLDLADSIFGEYVLILIPIFLPLVAIFLTICIAPFFIRILINEFFEGIIQNNPYEIKV
jgi:hypothetical protein